MKNTGFTLIELMISTVIVSTVLLLLASTSIQIGKHYYKAIYSSRTQEAGRNIMAQLSRNIAYLPDTPTNSTPGAFGFMCIGNVRYTYQLNTSVAADKHALLIDENLPACTVANPNMNSAISSTLMGKELVPTGMRLTKFSVQQVSLNFYTISLQVAHATDDLLISDGNGGMKCKGGPGDQFCDVSTLSVGVFRRFK